MHRITITIDEDLAAKLDEFVEGTGATSRSEATRDLIRHALSTRLDAPPESLCFGVTSCVIDQSVRNLATRVPQSRLDRHDQTVAVLSVPLDHSTSIDVSVMKGRVADIASYSESLFLQRGVMHGTLSLIPVTRDTTVHSHHQGPAHKHTHIKVQNSF
ncbi:MAG: CopG family transcriptional regulator, nickel-responsive regulator [Candidatus Hydrogenedentes bacterium]|nr:CopG family transcriptional regulator, nickel-responsive regulator [Candidatus Hydrogenedentota bacterium]